MASPYVMVLVAILTGGKMETTILEPLPGYDSCICELTARIAVLQASKAEILSSYCQPRREIRYPVH